MFDIKAKIEFDTRNKIIQMHVFLNNSKPETDYIC